jgi:hypothetical protein
MKTIFELPELLTLDGSPFTGVFAMAEADPNTCGKGCDKGCHSGGCLPGSTVPE